MRYFHFTLLALVFVALAFFACRQSNSTSGTASSLGVSGDIPEKRISSSDDEIVFLEHRLKYPDYEPKWDEDYLMENMKLGHRFSAAKMFSIAAHLNFYFYGGSYPETIEEMYELGLVPYEVDPETYDYVKWSLSYGFWANPGDEDPGGYDGVRFIEPVRFRHAPPKIQMNFKYQVMMRVFDSLPVCSTAFSFGGHEVYMPGGLKDCSSRIFEGWTLNEKFFTNPYTGKPMEQVSLSAPSPGDFSCIVTEKGLYEVIFHVE